jgi:predicted ester cyclase
MINININIVLSRFIQGVWNEVNAVVATWRWAGTHRGDLPGFPASGKQIKKSGAKFYYFANDRIDGLRQIVDRLGVLQQLRCTT